MTSNEEKTLETAVNIEESTRKRIRNTVYLSTATGVMVGLALYNILQREYAYATFCTGLAACNGMLAKMDFDLTMKYIRDNYRKPDS